MEYIFTEIKNNNPEGVRECIAAGEDLSEVSVMSGLTPLAEAASKGRLEMVEDIISTVTIDINQKSEGGLTAIMHSIIQGKEDVTDLLIDIETDLSIKSDDCGKTALMYSIMHSYSNEVSKLIKKCADINAMAFNGMTPIIAAIANKRNYSTVYEIARKDGVDLNTYDSEGLTLLMHVCQEKIILDKSSEKGKVLSARCKDKVFELMMELENLNINKKNFNGSTAIMLAAFEGNDDYVEALLKKGADPTIVNEDGYTLMNFGNMSERCKALTIEHQIKGSLDNEPKSIQPVKMAPDENESKPIQPVKMRF